MTNYEWALKLARMGFYVFPLVPGTKNQPVLKGSYKEYATRDPERIKIFWFDPVMEEAKDYNVGICTDRFSRGKALVVIDVDVDKEKGVNGLKVFRKLLAEGKTFPKTFTVKTPRGGYHLYYWAEHPVRQGAGKTIFGERGVDIRSRGGLAVGLGSTVTGRKNPYRRINQEKIKRCPKWLRRMREALDEEEERGEDFETTLSEYDQKRIEKYLKDDAPTAEWGEINDTSYKVLARIKDFGASLDDCRPYAHKWNETKCDPPMEDHDLEHQLKSVYAYGKRAKGVDSPVNVFKPIAESEGAEEEEEEPAGEAEHPVLKFNHNYAYALEGGSGTILWETTDPIDGKFLLDRIKLSSFHDRFASDTVITGDKPQAATKLWMKHPLRRTYDRVVFSPGREVRKSEYNLWNGFAVEPLGEEEEPTAQMIDGYTAFREHIRDNVCAKKSEARWLFSYFAHLIQKPWEKPIVSIVFRGKKGVGKDSLIDRVGHLIAQHYLMAADARYFVGNFNAHLEHCLMIVLNEAFWSGDKRADGILKNLVTGRTHNIERKGKEITVARNLTRVVILGNEEWLVPATLDERRFAVFDIGEGRMQDAKFFRDMRTNMEAGGYRLLLRKLLDYKIKADVNLAPNTRALMEQKLESLDIVKQWWRQCLVDRGIVGSPVFEEKWPKIVSIAEIRDSFYSDCRARGIRARLPDGVRLGKELNTISGMKRFRKRTNGEPHWFYKMAPVDECRSKWDNLMGHKYRWE